MAATPGRTALSGQVLEQNGAPLGGITVRLADSKVQARTDSTGRFLLSRVPAGHQILIVDGNAVGRGRSFGSYEMAVDLANHKTTTLGYTIWLTQLDASGNRTIKSPTEHETTITNPKIPGLEIKLPKGTVMRGASGKALRSLNVTAIPVNRTPSPLPAFQTIPLYYTIQPGGASFNKGVRIVYPNWSHLPPGDQVSFWNYDASGRGWYIYGHGSVSPDGQQIVPDPGVRVWKLSGAMISGTQTPPGKAPKGPKGGDPVDFYSGLFTNHKKDLELSDTIPIRIERTYRPGDTNSYSFGVGTQSLYDMTLYSVNNYHECDLILPDGAKVHYVNLGPGYNYRSENRPGPFFGSTISYDGRWELKLTNGMEYIFPNFAPLAAIRNPQGEELKITRLSGGTGPVTKIVSPHRKWVEFHYDGYNRITEAVDSGGQHLKYGYTNGLLTSATNPAGGVISYEYNTAGEMTAITDPRGNKYLQNSYYPSGRVESQTDAGGETFQFAYELGEEGQVDSTTLTDPRGSQKKVVFDSEGAVTSEVLEPGTEYEEKTTYEVQPKTGLVLAEEDPLGRKTTYEYDSNGNPTEITTLAGTGEATTWTASYKPGTDLVTKETDPAGHSTSYGYGTHGELTSVIDPEGHETGYGYEGSLLTSITDPLGHTTHFGYTGGELSSVTDPLGRTSTRYVNSLGQIMAITSPEGRRTGYEYDADGLITGETSPSGGKTSFEYDADGDLVKIVDPLGHETTRTYDSMDRLTSETNALGDTAEWSYDLAGDLASYTDRNGQKATFSYDPLRRLSVAAYGVTGLTSESSIAYQYDKGNQPVHIDDSAGGDYELAYTNLGQLESLESPQGTVGYSYDADGLREGMTASGQDPTSYSYDADGRLTGVSSGSESASLAYDAAGRPQSITLPDGVEERYALDADGEPTSISYQQGSETLGSLDYAYDGDGQLEAEWGSYARTNLPEALTSATYNAADELVEREGTKLTYDRDGNLTAEGPEKYSYNARGQLTGMSGETTASFGYDAFGRRVSKTLGGTTTDMLFDGSNVIQEAVGGSAVANVLTAPTPDLRFSRATGAGSQSYLTDRLGSTIGLANSSGELKTEYTYDPFGAVTESGAMSENPFKYTGREDDGTGLQYNRARYYDPTAGRFASQDPLGFAGSGTNLYLYTGGDPVDYTDPSGEHFYSEGGYQGNDTSGEVGGPTSESQETSCGEETKSVHEIFYGPEPYGPPAPEPPPPFKPPHIPVEEPAHIDYPPQPPPKVYVPPGEVPPDPCENPVDSKFWCADEEPPVIVVEPVIPTEEDGGGEVEAP